MTPKSIKLLYAASVALGVTSIYLLWLVGPLVTSAHDAVYHWSGKPSQLFIAPMLDFCICWLLLTMALLLTTGRARAIIWSGMIGLTPWMALKNWAYLTNSKPSHLLNLALLLIALASFLIPFVLWKPALGKTFEQVAKFAAMLYIFSALNGVLVLCQYAWFGWQARSLNAEFPLHHMVHRQSAQAGRPRVIWILFDQLSPQPV